MNNSGHNNIYSAEDIQNYLSGRLSPLQMHAMEKAALEDPFLAEAMEGYAAVPDDKWQKELAALKAGFAQQHSARIISITPKKNNWWKAAAAILVIGTTATLSYIFFNREATRPAIAKKEAAQEAAAAASDSVTAFTQDDLKLVQAESNLVTTTPPQKEYKTIIKDLTHTARDLVADSGFVYTPSKSGDAPAAIAAEEKTTEDLVVITKPAPQAPVGNNAAAPGLSNNNSNTEALSKNTEQEFAALKKERKAEAGYQYRNTTPLNKTFFAQVLGADNTPLPFANVNIKAENFGTYADVKGNFRLLSNDSLLTVEVKAAGFRPQTVTLKSNLQQNRIILTEDHTAYNNKTVIPSSAKSTVSRKAALVKDSVMNVEPADGWDNYNSYVDNNIDIPDDILKNNIHGQVELSFDVKANGAITNIKVDKSLCSNCDEAAIRMLQQGPQWKVKKGKKGKGKITVRF